MHSNFYVLYDQRLKLAIVCWPVAVVSGFTTGPVESDLQCHPAGCTCHDHFETQRERERERAERPDNRERERESGET